MSSQQKINTRNTVLILMVLFAVIMRVVNTQFQFLSNFTPVGAMAIFGGTYFNDKIKAYLIPMLALFVGDILIDSIYHINVFPINYWVYISFLAMVFFGTLVKKVNVFNVLLASLGGVLIHWLLTDIDPWLYGSTYSKGIIGYVESLIAAIPFERNMVLGDAVYGAILFGGFELAKSKYTFLRGKAELAL